MAEACASSSPSTDISNCDDANLDLSNLLNSSSGDQKVNSLSVYCPRCPSLILRAGQGIYVNDVRWALPDMLVQLNSKISQNVAQDVAVTHYQNFWRVADIFTFENVGYTNTVDGRYKYLTCADCECGPLGVQVLDDAGENTSGQTNTHFSYLALARVNHR